MLPFTARRGSSKPATAVDLLARNRDAWSGTHVTLFQLAEETAVGAQAMVLRSGLSAIPALLGAPTAGSRASWGSPKESRDAPAVSRRGQRAGTTIVAHAR